MQEFLYSVFYRTETAHWWYRVRRKIVRGLIKKYSHPAQAPKILDVGCGTGQLLKELNDFGECYGIDVSKEAVEFCKKRHLENIKIGNATQIPYEDEKFDIVLALDVLEHIQDDKLAVREIKRVLRTGGKFVVFVPAFQFLWGKTDEINHHFRRYRMPGLVQELEGEGLHIIRKSYFNTALFFPVAIMRFFINKFNIPIRSENEIGGKVLNAILFFIFNIESWFLRFFNFPYGVSIMIVCQK